MTGADGVKSDARDALLDRISDGILAYDREWRFTFVNRAAEKYFGLTRDQMLGRVAWQLFPASAGSEAQQRLLAAAAGTTPVEFELLTPTQRRWVAFKAYPSEAGLTVYFRDINAEKQGRDALQESEARYRALYDNSAEAVFLTDPSGPILAANPAACRLLGRTEAEICRLGRAGVVDPNDPNLPHFLAERRRSGRMRGDLVFMRGDGSRFVASTSSVVFRTADGSERTSMTFHDVTEQRRAERALRFLADLGDTLTAADVQTTVANLTSLIVPALADLCCVDLLEEGTWRRAGCAHRDGTTQPDCWGAPLTGVPATPELTTARLRVALRGGGHTLGVLTLRLLEDTRSFGPDDLALAQHAADRVGLTLENLRLYREALAARRMREEMMGIVVHDLRNPLNTIHLAAQVLARRGDSKELEMIRRATQRADQLVGDLLMTALIDGGRLPLDRRDEAVASLIDEAVALHRPAAEARALALTTSIAADLPALHADRHRMLQALSNLLSNAVKFTPEGGAIRVTASRSADMLQIAVADSGPGIPPASLPHIFDRFWQGTHAHKAGVGLGLAIVKGIMDAHGGRVEIESREGQGATFTLSLPLPRKPDQATEPGS